MLIRFPLLGRPGVSLVIVLALCSSKEAAEPMNSKEKPNRLAQESSPYLLQHAHNPVDWYPWGAEAFEKAKKENKPIFLSIGYSSCHWCHVMEVESFSDKGIAEIMNKHFVCIKVDREERPDIDEIYMTAVHVLGARGGWPLNLFLMPDGKPIIGGTYWPKTDRDMGDGRTMRGFDSVLKLIAENYATKQDEMRQQAETVAEHTSEALERTAKLVAIVDLDRKLAEGPADALREQLDPQYGGFGNPDVGFLGTKFPMPASLGAVLEQAHRSDNADLKKLARLTLEKMAYGGMYDQLGGGFHRYSTERTWTVPHFEKMLYDNAQLVELYARAQELDPQPLYARVIRETLAFIQREMTSPAGGFHSALDADSEGKEGVFYIWTPKEIETVLTPEEAALFRAAYGVTGKPNFEEEFILTVPKPLAEFATDRKLTEAELEKKLQTAREKLLERRSHRVRPFLDTKILTAWNGQMIAGYAAAGRVLHDPAYVQSASKAAEFLLKNLRTKDGRLMRTYNTNAEGKSSAKLNAYLDDYAFLVHGLLELHQATKDARWLNEAKSLTDDMLKWYGQEGHGGFYYTSSDHEKLFARPKEYSDGAQPSGNGIAARNLVKLASLSGDAKYLQAAHKSLAQFAGILKTNPSAAPMLGEALHEYLHVAGNKPVLAQKEPGKPAISADKATRTDEIASLAIISTLPGADGKQTITVTITIDRPWHIYAHDAGSQNSARSSVVFRCNGKELPATIDYPAGKKIVDAKQGDYFTYEGSIAIKAVVDRPKDGELEVVVKLRACTEGADSRCLLPASLKGTVK